MTPSVGIDYVEKRHLQSGIRVDEFIEIVRLDHFPILRDDGRLVQAGHPEGKRFIAVLRDNRSLNRSKNVDALVGKRAIGLPDLNDVGAMLKRQRGAAKIVGEVGVQREFVEVGILNRVIGVCPADLVAVTDTNEWPTHQNDAAGVQVRILRIPDDKIDLHPLINAEAGDG